MQAIRRGYDHGPRSACPSAEPSAAASMTDSIHCFRLRETGGLTSIRALMKTLQADLVMKAIVDGVDGYAELAKRAGIDPVELVEHAETLDRAIQLMRGFYKWAHENMKPAGLPPPPNPYLNKTAEIADQSAEYFAFEAIQRNAPDLEKAIFTCGQLGLEREAAEQAIETISIPWRNGWKTYARCTPEGRLQLMDKPPVKIHRHIDRFLQALKNA